METEEMKNTEETAETVETAEKTEVPENSTEEAVTETAADGYAEQSDDTDKNADKPGNGKESYNFKTFMNDVFDIAETLCIFMLIFFLLKAYVCDQAIVDGDSMVPTLHDEEKLLYSKIYTPDNNDIVIADNDRLGLIVKRIVAVEGQEIDIRDGIVYVDGEELDEQVYDEGSELTASHYINSLTQPRTAHEYPCTVPEGCVFLMGDNRGISEDSRGDIVGFVPVEDIVGKVFMRYSPVKDFKIFNY